jgi:hypothetical protein
MTQSYSKKLLRFILINYMDLSSGLSPRVFDEMKQFTKSRGSGNPQQTLTIWKSDIDSAISSLATKRGDIWALVSLGITPGALLHVSRHPQLSSLQRRIISGCILDPCSGCSGKFAPSCENNFILKRMQAHLNGNTLQNDSHSSICK